MFKSCWKYEENQEWKTKQAVILLSLNNYHLKKDRTTCNLSSCLLCSNTMSEWKPAIEANRKSILFNKHQVIFHEGSPVEGMYFVTSGIVKVHKKWGQDKELIIRFAGPGDIFGHRGLGGDSEYPVSATALTEANICFINLSFFYSSLKIHPDFQNSLLMFFASELRESERNMRDLAHMSVQGRVANALLKLERQFGKDEDGFLKYTPSRQDIASYAGTTYETLFRTLTAFANDNLIHTRGKCIGILNYSVLTLYSAQTE